MLVKVKSFLTRNRYRLACAVPVSTVLLPMTAFAEEPAGTGGIQTVLDHVTTLVTWCLTTFTIFTAWLIGDSLGGIYLGMFIVGFAMAAMFRLLHSA